MLLLYHNNVLLLGHVSKIVSILLSKLNNCPNTDTLLCYCNYPFVTVWLLHCLIEHSRTSLVDTNCTCKNYACESLPHAYICAHASRTSKSILKCSPNPISGKLPLYGMALYGSTSVGPVSHLDHISVGQVVALPVTGHEVAVP